MTRRWSLSAAQPENTSGVRSGRSLRLRDHLVAWDQLKSPDVSWLVPSMIPFGYTSLVSAPGGTGKSSILWDVAAKGSRGERVVGEPLPGPMVTLLVYLEGRAGDPQPQLTVSGAVPGMIWVFDRQGDFDLTAYDDLEEAIAETGARLVVIDTLLKSAPTLDINSYAETTALLSPLDGIADRNDCAVCVITHDRKGGKGEQERVMGSAGTVASVRSLVGIEKKGNGRRLTALKGNLGNADTVIDIASERVGDNAFRMTWSEPRIPGAADPGPGRKTAQARVAELWRAGVYAFADLQAQLPDVNEQTIRNCISALRKGGGDG